MNDILFDLDGTLSDPYDGIVRSINYALNKLGIQERSESELGGFIGPPLDYTFNALIPGCTSELLTEAVAKYRERYFKVGWQKNVLYAGIEDMLSTLIDNGFKLSVCTSKRTDIAKKIIGHFGLSRYFEGVYGADIGKTKSALISELIESSKCTANSWMIGDRKFDLLAAKDNGLNTIGVLWGYGSEMEITECEPDFIVRTPYELGKFKDLIFRFWLKKTNENRKDKFEYD